MKSLLQDLYIICKGVKEIHNIKPGLCFFSSIRSVFQAVTPFLNIYMSAQILDNLAEKQQISKVLMLAVITVFLNLFVMLGLFLLNRQTNLQRAKFELEYEMRMSLKVATLDYVDVENAKIHMLYQKIKEIKQMGGGGISKLMECFQNLVGKMFTILFSIAMTFSLFFGIKADTSSTLSGIVTSPIAIFVLIGMILVNVWVNMYANHAVTTKMYEIMNDLLPFNRVFGYYMDNYISTYHAGKDIRIYRQEKLINGEINSLFYDFRAVSEKLSRNQFRYSAFTSVSAVALSMSVYLFVGLRAMAGMLGVGRVVQYVSSINEFTNGFAGFMGELANLRANNEALKAYFDFMELPNDMYTGKLEISGEDEKYEIEFKNVSFRYPDCEDYVLKNLNLTFEWGEKIAIVGENGSGKTTLIKLLCRLYDPTEGEILLNGVNIRQYRYDEYLKLFSIVFQDYKLFSFSIAQNVAVDNEYNKNEVEECLSEAGFEDRLSKLSQGIETFLYKDFEESGVEVSGGETQKIALARALYKKAPMVILDEPTAALDPLAEAEIYARFNDMIHQKTAVYISHRLSSCRFCDRVLVFDKGVLVQQGNHETLSKQTDGKYFELWNAQAQYYVS